MLLLQRANIKLLARVTPHMVRHGMTTDMATHGQMFRVIAGATTHKSMMSTQSYKHVNSDVVKALIAAHNMNQNCDISKFSGISDEVKASFGASLGIDEAFGKLQKS